MQKPRLGQNFLVDVDACRAITAALGDMRESWVLEIGPGQGAITRLLARAAGHLTLVEYDPALATPLAADYATQSTVMVQQADILTVDLTLLAKQWVPHPEQSEGWDTATAAAPQASRSGVEASAIPLAPHNKLVVVGNLPYYITSDILLHLVQHHAVIDRAVLMVQREVAERITARPGSRDYGLLSATMQLYGEVELLFTLPPTAFAPPPDVYSSVFRWRIQPRLAELDVVPGKFLPFIRASFAQKRKTWANNLRNAGYRAEQVSAALDTCGLSASIRAEAVDLADMAAVFRRLQQPWDGR